MKSNFYKHVLKKLFVPMVVIGVTILMSVCCYADREKIVFLHHSTGNNVYHDGRVPAWFSKYNKANRTSFQITARDYPDSPYPWENYPFDYWNLWVNGACNSNNANIECMNTLTKKYDVIIYKHCFPVSHIEPDKGSPALNSKIKSLENYKTQYRALRDLMESYPNNLFILWTLPPLHRLATTPDHAKRANQFVDWVKHEFLSEDGKPHQNIFIFDFWGIVAEGDPNPRRGRLNCLKYDFEKDHNNDDSHPNKAANELAGPLFSNVILKSIKTFKKSEH